MRLLTNSECSVELPGDFAWERDGDNFWIWIALPRPKGGGGCIPIRLPVAIGPKVDGKWQWDGNEFKPTLQPSIHTNGIWHGWVRNGVLVEA